MVVCCLYPKSEKCLQCCAKPTQITEMFRYAKTNPQFKLLISPIPQFVTHYPALLTPEKWFRRNVKLLNLWFCFRANRRFFVLSYSELITLKMEAWQVLRILHIPNPRYNFRKQLSIYGSYHILPLLEKHSEEYNMLPKQINSRYLELFLDTLKLLSWLK